MGLGYEGGEFGTYLLWVDFRGEAILNVGVAHLKRLMDNVMFVTLHLYIVVFFSMDVFSFYN